MDIGYPKFTYSRSRPIPLASRFIHKWHSSIAFKLSAATFLIVLLVASLQLFNWLHIHRLSDAQGSITTRSVPLLQKSQEFARLTTRVLAKTSLLENDLPKEELQKLRSLYDQNERLADETLADIIATYPDQNAAAAFHLSRKAFTDANDLLFSNQLMQRDQESRILALRAEILGKTAELEDLLDRLLVRATTRMLTSAARSPDATPSDATASDLAISHASAIEVLNSIKGAVFGISQTLGNLPGEADIDALEKDVSFRIRSLSQLLVLLSDSTERMQLASALKAVNQMLTAPDGLFVQLRSNQDARNGFNRLKREQAAAVETLDLHADEIVATGTSNFNADISTASAITTTIVWIGMATASLVLIGILLVNHYVIRKQISARFTLLTEDILTISKGDYGHDIRVVGADEFGDIAKSLDVFKQQAAELKRSNAELERFAYVAAHDLRSPLQAIQDLACWTLEDERDNLTPECIENLELLIKRSARLSVLQSDLLTYAKAGDMDTSIATFTLEDEVSKLADMLDPNGAFNIRIEGGAGAITTFGLPTRQILLNLITNAIKHHDKKAGQITVRYEHTGAAHRICVEDDGPGIEPRFQVKIFELFKTLQSRDMVEGSGLGLALITKLLTQLDGKLAVYSNAPEERGSRFVFEIADMAKAGDRMTKAA